MKTRSVWIGFDEREAAAYAVARRSIQRHSDHSISVNGIVLQSLIDHGAYTRQTKEIGSGPCPQCQLTAPNRLHDVISDAPMSTQFAISRFFGPHLWHERLMGEEREHGWLMFCDCDVLVRKSLIPLFEMVEAHPEKALFCVCHNEKVEEGTYKMDRQVHLNYSRKYWSSVMMLNCDHPANAGLKLDLLNGVPGRDLHKFCWLEDDLIGELPLEWNWLVGKSPPIDNPALVHFTDGGPWLPEYKDVPFADEWRAELNEWAA